MTKYQKSVIETAALLFSIELAVFVLQQIFADPADRVPVWALLSAPIFFTLYYALWLREKV